MVKELGEGKHVGDFAWTPLVRTLWLIMFPLDKSSVSPTSLLFPGPRCSYCQCLLPKILMNTAELVLQISQTGPQSDARSSVSGKEGRGSRSPLPQLHSSLLTLEPEISWERNLLGVVSLDKLFPCLSRRNSPVGSSFRRLRGTQEEKRACSQSDRKLLLLLHLNLAGASSQILLCTFLRCYMVRNTKHSPVYPLSHHPCFCESLGSEVNSPRMA